MNDRGVKVSNDVYGERAPTSSRMRVLAGLSERETNKERTWR